MKGNHNKKNNRNPNPVRAGSWLTWNKEGKDEQEEVEA